MSGLWLENKGKEIRVAVVGTGSPASAAGIQVGDRITGLDFRSAIARITGAPGQSVELSVVGNGPARSVRFALTPFL
jgi:C-terminal processing protease CtpA/Prc